MKILYIALLATLLLAGCPNNQVTLKSGPFSDIVQMFADPGSGRDAFADFADGTRCTLLDGPHQRDLGSSSSSYYRLTCNGKTGYINANRVD